MCVVFTNKGDLYSNIKKTCCVERSIPSQVMCSRTITPKGGNVRSLMTVGTKVAIQMATKIGSAPYIIKMPLNGLMTIGFDVATDSRDKKISYGAMVATMDIKTSAEYFSAVSKQTSGEELSHSFMQNVMKALKAYQQVHNALPQRICIYRDGVGDSQVPFVLEHELKPLQENLKRAYESANSKTGPKLIFMIVSKRINSRLFLDKHNPPPGTVVDDVITLPER